MKQGYKDLVAINYRFQRLAGKICKTQIQCSQINQKFRVRFVKHQGWARVEQI
jgi:hypothetical protein